MLILGIQLFSLVLTADSTLPNDLLWTTAQISTADAATSNVKLATASVVLSPTASVVLSPISSAVLTPIASAVLSPTPVGSTVTVSTAAQRTSHRLNRTIREELPDYEATSGEDKLHAASGNVEGASSTETQGRRESLAPPDSTATSSWREESSGTAAVAPPNAAPEATNLISWLPSWCRNWPIYGPLHVPRSVQLQAFAEALVEHTVDIGNYWIQAQLSAYNEEHPNTAEPYTRFMSMALQQVEMLQNFYRWIYQQLNTAEDIADFTPKSVYSFLGALQRQAALVTSFCKWSPSESFTFSHPDSGLLHNFFRVMDQQSFWLNLLSRWAVSQYNLTAVLHRIPRLEPPVNLNEDTPPFNAQHLSTKNWEAGCSAPGVAAVGNSIFTTGERGMMVGNENVDDMPLGATAHDYYCPVPQLEQQKHNNQEGKLPTCVSQGMSKKGHEAEQLIGTSRIQINNSETGMLLENQGDELGAASARPQIGLDGDHTVDNAKRDEDSCDQYVQFANKIHEWLIVNMVNRLVEEEQVEEDDTEDDKLQQMIPEERNVDSCSETPILQELGSDFDPHFLFYVKCSEQGEACKPPEKCMPVSSVVTVEMNRWAALPEFPHTFLSVQEVSNDRHSISLLVATSCVCTEPSGAN